MFSIFAPLRKGGTLVTVMKNEDRDGLNRETGEKQIKINLQINLED